ncbi:hypothetical protein [Hydrogenophaga pseudoflava]|uniref:Lipoprotein n=1 Tax=Hydrogenophaga pseudoflava TaxID=47421 RepID=A0A4V1ABF4_HYDPS|nr:hypothetical protein [Hydrogenophaga pseudoflava]QBM27773.1 hypothetical protein HPF_08755 [Hydrogenophaga pseudoflava]
MAFRLFLVFMLAVTLAGCARNRLPKPVGVPEFVTHSYQISAKNNAGAPVEGVRFHAVKTDLATVFTHDDPVRVHETVVTDSNGIANVSLRVQLGQHWKGGYYEADNEPEIVRQAFPHGGKDVWGYFSEIRGEEVFATKFSSGVNVRETIPTDVLVRTPASHGGSAEHVYRFQAVDVAGNPIEGARVALTVADYARTNGEGGKVKEKNKVFECLSDALGFCVLRVPVEFGAYYSYDFPSDSAYKPFDWLYKSNLKGLYFGYFSGGGASAGMPGFFESDVSKVTRATYSGAEPDGDVLKIAVPRPSDYFCKILKESESQVFARNLDSWVRAIRLSSWARKSDLSEICRESFKGRQHVSLTLEHNVKYNELKLNNYGIGVLVFDEVVRKMLKTLVSASGALPVDGFKISVKTQKSNFADNFSPAEWLTYDFYFPKSLVAKYVEADVSGQALVNGSIVLLNGERIDLDLK